MPADLPESSHTPLAEISQGPSAFEQFLDRNQKNLVILAILVALGTAGYVVYSGIEDSKQKTAGAALNKAEDLASLQSIISEHPDTRAAKSAMLLLADKQWSEGQQDNAVETLRKFIDSNADHPAIGSAKASLASKLMAQGKSGDATTLFQEIADDPKERFIAPFALISLGDIAKAAGDIAKAETHYNRINTEFSGSSFNQTAGKRIASLKAKAPVEIAPPPKPPEPATPPAADASVPAPLLPGTPGSSQLPGGITVTPVDPDAPATDIPSSPAQESVTPPGSDSQPATPEP
jgi:predicted negative regulator of RcsB-dependent stress response